MADNIRSKGQGKRKAIRREVKTYFTNDLIMKWHLFVYKCKSIIARLS